MPHSKGGAPSVPKIFGTPYLRQRGNMSAQICVMIRLDDKKVSTVSTTALWSSPIFDTRMRTRGLFAVASLLVFYCRPRNERLLLSHFLELEVIGLCSMISPLQMI